MDILGRTPLYIACSLGNSSIAQTLLPLSNWRVLCHEKAQSLDSPLLTNVAQGRPPLHAAVVNNHLNTVSALLNYGVDVDQLDLEGRTAIISAAKLGLKDMCQMLILNGADVNARCVSVNLNVFNEETVSLLCFVFAILDLLKVRKYAPAY